MKGLKSSLVVFLFLVLACVALFLFTMYINGKTSLSSNSQDWANFGSYLGGVLAPIAAFLAAYQLYRSFELNNYIQKVQVIRTSLTRLDTQLESALKQPINNDVFGEDYRGVSFESIVIDITNRKVHSFPECDATILALLHTFAIHFNSVRYYALLLKEFPSEAKDGYWLSHLERAYWSQKYIGICERMISVVGEESFRKKCTQEQYDSFNFVLARKGVSKE